MIHLSAQFLFVPVFLGIFLTIHEIGHVAAAKMMNLHLKKVGFSKFPFPHIFVEVVWPQKKSERIIFLLSGFFTIISLFLIIMFVGIDYKPLLVAFGLQLAIETNPVYSDFVILGINDKVGSEVRRTKAPYKEVYNRVYSNYIYSTSWYLHFILWSALVVSVINFLIK